MRAFEHKERVDVPRIALYLAAIGAHYKNRLVDRQGLLSVEAALAAAEKRQGAGGDTLFAWVLRGATFPRGEQFETSA